MAVVTSTKSMASATSVADGRSGSSRSTPIGGNTSKHIQSATASIWSASMITSVQAALARLQPDSTVADQAGLRVGAVEGWGWSLGCSWGWVDHSSDRR